MACPHGLRSSPATCSQCLGAPARKIELAEDGEISIDGKSAGMSTIRHPTIAEVQGAGPRLAKTLRARPQRCSRCSELGHKAGTCTARLVHNPDTDEFEAN